MIFVWRFYHAVNVVRWSREANWFTLGRRKSWTNSRNSYQDCETDKFVNYVPTFAALTEPYLLKDREIHELHNRRRQF